jgi:hypothetical protein
VGIKVYVWTMHVSLPDPPFGLAATQAFTIIAPSIETAIERLRPMTKGEIYSCARGVEVDYVTFPGGLQCES